MKDKLKQIIIIADSTAMPRDGLPYEKTWIYRLKESLSGYDIIDRSARGSTTDRLVTEGGAGVDLLETYMPRAAIISLGITDCAPRLFKKPGLEYRIVSRILPRKFRSYYIDYVKKNRGRNPLYTEVPPERFRMNLNQFCSRAEKISCTVIPVLIMKAGSGMLSKSPHADKNINLYNSIMQQLACEHKNVYPVNPFDEADIDCMTLDEVHPGIPGHDLVFSAVSAVLKKEGF